MRLEALRVQQFRNLSRVEIEPHERFNIFSGANGQGKTNLLEAIYLLSAVRSFRARRNASMVEFGADTATLEARVDRGGHERIVRIEIGDSGKDVFLNDSPVRRLSEFFGTVNVVKFGPEDLSILKGSPSERRDFLDEAIFNAHPAYRTEIDHYEEVRKQRNALLKDDEPDRALLSVYDEQLVQYGADLVARRIDFIDRFRPVLRSVFREIFDAALDANVEYDMKWVDRSEAPRRPPRERDEVESVLESALERTAETERERGYTLVGPHRDDLYATLEGRDVTVYGSQGQQRAFVLAMKIAVIRYLKEHFHFAPILLLDDVSSELDRERNRSLFQFLRSSSEGQVFITTTHRDYIHLEEDVRSFAVEEGRIEPTAGEAP